MRTGVHAHTCRHACAGVDSLARTPLIFGHFCHGFAAMASMAQGLQIVSVDESGPDAPVGNHVVNIRCPNSHQVRHTLTDCPLGTFPAKRFLQQLSGAKIVHPDGQRVPGMPGRCLGTSALIIFRPVSAAVAVPDQLTAARMRAGPKRFQCHRITSGQKEKACTKYRFMRYMAQALRHRH